MAAIPSDEHQYVVKRTFIEFEEARGPPCLGRTRAHSESALDSLGKPRNAFTMDLEGWSDADTGEEMTRSGSSYSVDTTPGASALPNAAKHADAVADAVANSRGSDHANCPVVSGAECEHESRVQSIFGDRVVELLRENARLAAENELLQREVQSPQPATPAAVPVVQVIMPRVTGYPPAAGQAWREHPGKDGGAHGCRPRPAWGWNSDAAPAVAQRPQPQKRQSQPRGQQLGRAAAPATGKQMPSQFGLSSTAPSDREVEGCTTVMLRNLPNNYTRTMVLAMINREGFEGKYDFLYLPIDFSTHACLGYAFVNLVSSSLVPQFYSTFSGYSRWVLPSRKTCAVTWSGPQQGFEAQVERYRDSPVMHHTVPETYQPVVFKDGVRLPFPAPTRPPRAPRTRTFSTACR